MDKPVDISQEETWPEEIINWLDINLAILDAYEADKKRVERLCEVDVLVRGNPPKLCYSQERDFLLERIESYLSDRCLLGFHCSRLHESEIEIVKKQGLKPLSEEFAYGRVQQLQNLGVISTKIALRLISENAVNNKNGNRLGKICFIFSRSSLMNEGGVSPPLSYWGGEALYWAHENDAEVGPVLKTIGRPCIVQVAVPIAMLNTYTSVSEKLVSIFLFNRGIATTDDGLLQGSINQALNGSYIQQIIEYGMPDFEALTGCNAWRCRVVGQGKCAAGQGRVIQRVKTPPRKAGQPLGSESLEADW